jgi:hypothetical protein
VRLAVQSWRATGSFSTDVPTALDNGQRSPRKLLAAVVRKLSLRSAARNSRSGLSPSSMAAG